MGIVVEEIAGLDGYGPSGFWGNLAWYGPAIDLTVVGAVAGRAAKERVDAAVRSAIGRAAAAGPLGGKPGAQVDAGQGRPAPFRPRLLAGERGSTMRRRTFLGLTGAGALAAGAGVAARDYRRVLGSARRRVAGLSNRIDTRAGAMEYAEAGEGPPLRMIHGTGGGFEQGLAFTRRLWEGRWRVIAPSRFGYLGSDFPEDHGSEAQADAFVDLLDHLGLDSLAVAGGSAGALSALAFALRHPERCSALLPIVPATHVPGRPAPRPPSAMASAIIGWGLRSDVLFWAGVRLAHDQMIASLLATDPELVAEAPTEERARVEAILRGILPVSAKTAGLLSDGALAGNPAPLDLAAIRAPTLAISCEDDRFLTADAARHIAASVPGARLLLYPTGGHVWVGRDVELWGEVDGFLRSL